MAYSGARFGWGCGRRQSAQECRGGTRRRPAAGGALRSPPTSWGPADRLFLVSALGDPSGLPHGVAGFQGHCNDDGRNDADLGAIQASAVAAHGDRRRAGNEEVRAGRIYEDLLRSLRQIGECAIVAGARAAEPCGRSPLTAALGPEVVIGEPSGGYVGRLVIAPEHG